MTQGSLFRAPDVPGVETFTGRDLWYDRKTLCWTLTPQPADDMAAKQDLTKGESSGMKPMPRWGGNIERGCTAGVAALDEAR